MNKDSLAVYFIVIELTQRKIQKLFFSIPVELDRGDETQLLKSSKCPARKNKVKLCEWSKKNVSWLAE